MQLASRQKLCKRCFANASKALLGDNEFVAAWSHSDRMCVSRNAILNCQVLGLQEPAAARGSDWCRGDSTPLAPGDSQRFPYAIVEIKLQGVGQPAWIQRLVASGAHLSRFPSLGHSCPP